jgi:hypothetical protein
MMNAMRDESAKKATSACTCKCDHSKFHPQDYHSNDTLSYYKEACLKKQLFPLAMCAGGCGNHAKDIKVGMQLQSNSCLCHEDKGQPQVCAICVQPLLYQSMHIIHQGSQGRGERQ